jgi:hypothetical protein
MLLHDCSCFIAGTARFVARAANCQIVLSEIYANSKATILLASFATAGRYLAGSGEGDSEGHCKSAERGCESNGFFDEAHDGSPFGGRPETLRDSVLPLTLLN